MMTLILTSLPLAWTFVKSRFGILVIACSVAALGAGHMVRQHDEQVAAQAQLAQAQKRIADLVVISDAASARERAATDDAAALHEKVLAYDTKLSKKPVAGCHLVDGDIHLGGLRLKK